MNTFENRGIDIHLEQLKRIKGHSLITNTPSSQVTVYQSFLDLLKTAKIKKILYTNIQLPLQNDKHYFVILINPKKLFLIEEKNGKKQKTTIDIDKQKATKNKIELDSTTYTKLQKKLKKISLLFKEKEKSISSFIEETANENSQQKTSSALLQFLTNAYKLNTESFIAGSNEHQDILVKTIQLLAEPDQYIKEFNEDSFIEWVKKLKKQFGDCFLPKQKTLIVTNKKQRRPDQKEFTVYITREKLTIIEGSTRNKTETTLDFKNLCFVTKTGKQDHKFLDAFMQKVNFITSNLNKKGIEYYYKN